jgi:ubiquinone biosynthesis protein UbiJ
MPEETLIKILAHIEKLQQYAEEQFTEINARLDRIEKRLISFEEKFDVLTEDIVEVRRQQRRLTDRVAELERKPIQ